MGRTIATRWGVCIEPPEYVIGLQRFEQYIYRTQPEGVRSGPGDLDLIVYSLRKWLRLALAGNPTILLPLFVPTDHLVSCGPLGSGPRSVPRRADRALCAGRKRPVRPILDA